MKIEYNVPKDRPLDVFLGDLKVCTCDGPKTAQGVRDTLELADTYYSALRQVKSWCELNRRQDATIYKIVCDAIKKGDETYHGTDDNTNQLRAAGRHG